MQLVGLIGSNQKKVEEFVYDDTSVEDSSTEIECKETIHLSSVASDTPEVGRGQWKEVTSYLLFVTCFQL